MEQHNGIDENGHPYSYCEDHALFSALSMEEQQLAQDWVNEYCVRSVALNRRRTSYGLKHTLEHCTGVYMTNNQFKDLMLRNYHKPEHDYEQNWRFYLMEGPLRKAEKGKRNRS